MSERKMWKRMVVILWVLVAANAFAVDWTGGGADDLWQTGANWESGVAPTIEQQAVILGGATVTIDSTTVAVASRILGPTWWGENVSSVVNITGGSLTTAANWHVMANENGYTGTVNMSGGVATIGNRMYLSSGTGGKGIYNMSGGTLSVVSHLFSGNGEGISEGTINLTDGTINTGGEFILGCYDGKGTINMSGGVINANNAGDSMWLGGGVSGSGFLYMTGGTINVANRLTVCYADPGGDDVMAHIQLDGGTINTASLGMRATGYGISTVDITGGTLTLAGDQTFSTSELNTYIGNGWITAGGSLTLNTFYDTTLDRTFVTAIPEPATMLLLILGGFSLVRSKKARING